CCVQSVLLFQDLVLRLDILRKLAKHGGSVNTVSFNSSGDILMSGSDDKKVILWHWEGGHAKFSFHSGHVNTVIQAKFVPYSDDHIIITYAADGQVLFCGLKSGGM
ncbi:DDB1- and CUL4-associated factor 8, partial [Bienertia sinuspersici]